MQQEGNFAKSGAVKMRLSECTEMLFSSVMAPAMQFQNKQQDTHNHTNSAGKHNTHIHTHRKFKKSRLQLNPANTIQVLKK